MALRQDHIALVRGLLAKVGQALYKATGATLKGSGTDDLRLAKLDAACGELYHLERHEKTIAPDPSPAGSFSTAGNWFDLVLSEIESINYYGEEWIGSCSEALLKTHGLMNPWHSDAAQRKPFYYRGEHRSGWPLISRLGRKRTAPPDPDNLLEPTQTELDLLSDFQARVLASNSEQEEIFGRAAPLDSDDPGWWAIMQHYDACHGTRMVDLTSSIFCGLYFACVDWDGAIDEESHGRLYLFPSKMGRDEARDASAYDADDLYRESAADYFKLDSLPEIVRFRTARGSNPRLMAQDGFFLWQPCYDAPLDMGQYFSLPVHREAKKSIVRELYSIGYTPDRVVRGDRGRQALERVKVEVGIS